MSSKILKLGTFAIPKIGSSNLMGYPPPFFPTDLTSLFLWLNNDPTTMTISGGNKVSQWSDSSGNSRNFTQGTGSVQPSYVAGGVNGQDAIYFGVMGGNAGYLDSATFSPITAQPFEIFAVWNLDASSTQSNPTLIDATSGTNRNVIGWSSNNIQVGSGTITNTYSKTRPFTPIITNVRFNGVNSQVFENNVSQGVFSLGANSLQTIRIGRNSSLQALSTLSGYVCESFIYNRLLTTDEKLKIDKYLKDKYAL